MSENAVRVRFAPSPTGIFHVGGARSALFNWAVAQNSNGKFVLRIEDTDAARNQPEWIDGIISALSALGIDSRDDSFEGPFFQTANVTLHLEAAQRLSDAGQAYYCDCLRQAVIARSGSDHSGYDGYCRDRNLEKAPGRALRFKTPSDGETVVQDVIRGDPAFPNASIEDFVIVRGDGSPVFLLANVVDDAIQGITHVIRGEEHLSNTPKQQLLWQALGYEIPTWAHLPLIVNEKRQKLSKRRDRVSLESFLAEGYLPDAMTNSLMLLGWGPRSGPEVQPFSTLAAQFRLQDVTTAPAYFDVKKLTAINGDYIRSLSLEDFSEACLPWLQEPYATWPKENFSQETFEAIAELAQTRVAVLSDITPLTHFLFVDKVDYEVAAWNKTITSMGVSILRATEALFGDIPWRAEELKSSVLIVAEAHGLKIGKAQAPIRMAVTGRGVGLPLFESMEILGREKVQQRITAALDRASSLSVDTIR